MAKKPKYIVIHHTAVSYKKNPNQWRATDRYHKAKGWGGGGYNYEISAAGSVHQFRKDGTWTAAQYQRQMNDGRAISICLDGNFDIEDPTPKQMESLRKLVREKMAQYGIIKNNVLKHRDLAINSVTGKPYKTCPGARIPEDIYEYLFPPNEGLNTINIRLRKDMGGNKIYLVNQKTGQLHHIQNEEVFYAWFGSFKNAVWEEGPIDKKLISFSIRGV